MNQLQLYFLLLFLSQAALSIACYIEYEYKWNCLNQGGSFTINVTHYLEEDEQGQEYDAHVIFDWGESVTDLGMETYAEEYNQVIQTHRYLEDGEYYAGYTVKFDEDLGCNREISERNFKVWFDNGDCGAEKYAGDVPTRTPTEVSALIWMPFLHNVMICFYSSIFSFLIASPQRR
mmetsp:Transcript_29807/g.62789  ORF Transcript_29807/g.62789 Transcript_29807/m.62789 type:complete len:176 (-) Transcript_29807:39-566(-)